MVVFWWYGGAVEVVVHPLHHPCLRRREEMTVDTEGDRGRREVQQKEKHPC